MWIELTAEPTQGLMPEPFKIYVNLSQVCSIQLWEAEEGAMAWVLSPAGGAVVTRQPGEVAQLRRYIEQHSKTEVE